MLRIINNPIDIILRIIDTKYKKVADSIERITFTVLDNDMSYQIMEVENEKFAILINPVHKDTSLDVEQVCELLSSAFANLISGDDNGTEAFDEAYDTLQDDYCEYLKTMHEIIDAGEIQSLTNYNEELEVM